MNTATAITVNQIREHAEAARNSYPVIIKGTDIVVTRVEHQHQPVGLMMLTLSRDLNAIETDPDNPLQFPSRYPLAQLLHALCLGRPEREQAFLDRIGVYITERGIDAVLLAAVKVAEESQVGDNPFETAPEETGIDAASALAAAVSELETRHAATPTDKAVEDALQMAKGAATCLRRNVAGSDQPVQPQEP